MPVGAWNKVVERGQTRSGPEIEQTGLVATINFTSSDSVQPLAWPRVKRSTAFGELTWAVVESEPGSSIVATPETTVQFVEVIGNTPEVAVPRNEKAFESPSAHWV